MANAQKHIALLVLFLAIPDTHVAVALESTMTSCSARNTACTYQHELRCPQHSTVSVQGGNQHFDFDFGFCLSQGLTCSHGCCTGCTVAMTSEETSSLRQRCDGRQNCSVSVTRTSVTCGVFNKDPYYSHKSTVEYQCVQAPSHPSTTEATQTVSRFPESSESVTEIQTSSSGVSEETMTSSDKETAVSDKVPSTPEAWSVSTSTIDYSQGISTGEGEKGGHSSQTAAPSNMAGVIGGAVVGAVTLVALSVALIVCWRRRRMPAVEKKVPDGKSNPGYDLSMENLGNPSCPRVPPEEVTQAPRPPQNAAAADAEYDRLRAKKTDDVTARDVTYGHLNDEDDEAGYDHTGAKGKRDVINNVYDGVRAAVTSEDTYDHARPARKPDVINNLYDHAVPGGNAGREGNDTYDLTRGAKRTVVTSDDYNLPSPVQTSEPTYQNVSGQESKV